MSNLKYIVLFIAILFSNVNFLFGSDSIKIWSAKDKLERSDFLSKTKLEAQNKFINFDEHGVLVASIKVAVQKRNSQIIIDVIPFMNRSKSWISSSDTSISILNHEQIHFDITELVARKLRYQIGQLQKDKVTDVSKYANMINDYISDSLDYYQSDFDKNTLHGFLNDKQTEYDNWLRLELNKYCSFSTDLYEFSDIFLKESFGSEDIK
jgi:hypothetical protein